MKTPKYAPPRRNWSATLAFTTLIGLEIVVFDRHPHDVILQFILAMAFFSGWIGGSEARARRRLREIEEELMILERIDRTPPHLSSMIEMILAGANAWHCPNCHLNCLVHSKAIQTCAQCGTEMEQLTIDAARAALLGIEEEDNDA